ncbi:MAG: nucleotidyltransferase family protein [Candidatus Competibacteraceae bacterium]|nr:nucleotidyltransferase family protein [Candidatus Competibacteraceae bacterium]
MLSCEKIKVIKVHTKDIATILNPSSSKQGLLLAAGWSRRFGADKLLQPLADGTPIGLAAARHLRAALSDTLVVVNADNEWARLLVQDGFSVTICPRARDGMGNSLAWGVEQTARASAWIVALADMPFIQPATIRRVADAIDHETALAAPVFQGKRGHPVGFGRAYAEELKQLTGDEGARAILRRHQRSLNGLPCEDPGVLADINAPADLPPSTC